MTKEAPLSGLPLSDRGSRAAETAAGAADVVVHLVLGPRDHGVTRHGANLAGPRRVVLDDVGPGARDLAAVLGASLAHEAHPDGRGFEPRPVHVHLTDALLGADHGTIDAGVTAIEHASRPVHITLHDIPQPAEGQARYARRAALYARLVRAAASVQVCSEAERIMLSDTVIGDIGSDVEAREEIGVVPLPIDARPSSENVNRMVGALAADAPVGVLGFVHPGKDPQLALDVAAALGRDLVLLGAVVAGHEGIVDDLRRDARARGVDVRVLGHLSEDEMDEAIASVAVPLAAYRHISASGSIGRWIAAGRRPLALATPWVRELDATAPGVVNVVESGSSAAPSEDTAVRDALVAAAREALDDPMLTVTDPSRPGLLTTADAARRQADLLAAHLGSQG